LSSVAHAAESDPEKWLDVEVGHSTVFHRERAIGRVLTSDPNVASLKLLEQGQVQILGQSVGSTDLWVWYLDDMRNPVSYDLTVHQDLSGLIRRVDTIVDGAPPTVYPLEDRLVIEGPVDSIQTLEQLADMARVYDKDFVNLMSVTGDHQIQLEVVFAEINRTALRELGMNGMWGDDGNLAVGMTGPNVSQSGFVTNTSQQSLNQGVTAAAGSGTFNFLGTVPDLGNLSLVLSVLETHNISKTLAKPTLVALSGQQAEFLAGGEIPIPVAQFGNRITLEFKEYGVRLVFVPTVLGADVIDMRVYVEVSDVDTATGIRVTGIEVPGFVARKTQSHLRVESGMTFAMAGMLSDSVRATYAKVPILGDLPIIGAPFRYVQHRKTETELMIFVTPRLVRPLAEAEVPAPPGTTEDYNPSDWRLFLWGGDHRALSRTAEPTGPVGLSR
jgi:pilus assembly protein CpaC